MRVGNRGARGSGRVVPPAWDVAGWVAGLAALVLLAAQQFFALQIRKAFTAAEEVKRAYLVADGCGERISAAKLAELNKRHGELKLMRNRTTHHARSRRKTTPHARVGICVLVEDLQGVMCDRYFRRAALSASVLRVGVPWALVLGERPRSRCAAGQALLGYGSLLGERAGFWVRWRECEDTTRVRCDARSLSHVAQRTEVVNPEVGRRARLQRHGAGLGYPIPDRCTRREGCPQPGMGEDRGRARARPESEASWPAASTKHSRSTSCLGSNQRRRRTPRDCHPSRPGGCRRFEKVSKVGEVIGSHTRDTALHLFSDVDYLAVLSKGDVMRGGWCVPRPRWSAPEAHWTTASRTQRCGSMAQP